MKLTIIGTGYVGLVAGTCLAEVGHTVQCVDNDLNKVERLSNGQIDIYEPGLEPLVKHNVENHRLVFTDDISEAIKQSAAVFIAVGTPPNEDGSTDLSHILAVAATIGETLDQETIVVIKSTVPVGTCNKVKHCINQKLQDRNLAFIIDVVSNPEFLKEGAAVNDFSRPDRIIIGSDNKKALEVMREIYAPYNRHHDKILIMDAVSAELTKYAANAMLATKISFINEIANIAEHTGADIEQVRKGIGSDPRIGYDFIYAGCGYGGSCFPKDIKSLAQVSRDAGYQSRLLEAVDEVNEAQKNILFKHLAQHFSDGLAGKSIGIWGLAFKPNTNDIREAPSCVLMKAIWAQGATVKAYDPVAMPAITALFGKRDDLDLCADKETAIENVDALVICTEWKAFKILDFDNVRGLLKQPVIIDGRNLYEPGKMQEEGFVYYGVGRGESCL